ncbi:MAG: ribonuclease P protein component 1 [Candidatus Hadarchaeum sp.]|jgi:ribonuclease P protein subunit POP4|nr:ribonuclease P protein component 1 [Candidatus Hadarchaeum sp.]
MPITKQNVSKHELIGLEARVVNSSDKNLIGTYGTIIDETKDMLVIDQVGKPRIVQKKSSAFKLTLPSGEDIDVDGAKLVARPEDRIKKRVK